MKIYCISWKDERWSASKEDLAHINKIINKDKKNSMNNWGEKMFIVIGWIVMSPFIIRDLIIVGFKRLMEKIKNGKGSIKKS